MPDIGESNPTSSKLWNGTANETLAAMFTHVLSESLYEGVESKLRERENAVTDQGVDHAVSDTNEHNKFGAEEYFSEHTSALEAHELDQEAVFA